MYLSGSKWSMRKKRRRPPNPWRIVILIGLIGAAFYFERVIVPSVPPLFVPTSTPTRSSAAVLLEAQSLFQAGKLSQAETAYEEAISVDPKQVNNYIDLARIQALSGELDKAETSARDALLIDSNSAAAQAMLAWVLDLKANQAGNDQDRLKFLDQAQQAIDRALKQNPGSALVHAINAQVQIDQYLFANEQDAYQLASDEAKKAVAIDPASLDAQYALGVVMESTGNYEDALVAYQTALRANGNLSLLHLKVGDMYLAEATQGVGDASPQDLTDSAINSYVHAASLAPNDTIPLRRIVQAYSRTGQYARASQYAADAVHLAPDDPYLHGLLGQMLRKNNQLQEAVVELGWAVRGGRIPGEWTVDGKSIQVTDSTRLEGQFSVGDQVQIQTTTDVNDALVAQSIAPINPGTPVVDATENVVTGEVQAMQDSVVIEGLRLDPGDARSVELYYTYALALSEAGECDLAIQVSQAILLGIQNDDTARFNAEEALRTCGAEVTPTATPAATAAP
jgi:tetratricopeptide (TPR) repeat protein